MARDTKERAWARAAGAAVRARGRNMAGQVGEMCITNKRRFSLFAIVPPDNPGLLFITAITYCLASRGFHANTCCCIPPHSRMPATRLRPVVELTPLPPAVRALYARSLSPAPPQAQHRTVSHPTRPTHHAPLTARSSAKNAAGRPQPSSSSPSTPAPRNVPERGSHPRKRTIY